jgi:hypothetical protein
MFTVIETHLMGQNLRTLAFFTFATLTMNRKMQLLEKYYVWEKEKEKSLDKKLVSGP